MRHGVLFNKKLQPFLYSEVYMYRFNVRNVTCIRTKAIKMQPFYSCFRSIIFYIIKSILYAYSSATKEKKNKSTQNKD